MADNSVFDPGTGGDTYRSKDRAGVKTEIVGIDLGIGTGSESLMSGSMPINDNSGSITVDNAGTFAVQAALTSTTNAGATAKTSDYDTGAGTDTVTQVGIALPASGGAVQGGTATNPIRTDPTGTTTQPVSGTVTANAGSGTFTVSGTVTANAGTGTLGTNVAQVAGTATDTNSGNKSAGTQRVVLATDQPQLTNALKVDGSGVTQPVSAAVGSPVFVTPTPSTTGGWTPYTFGALSTTVQTVKASTGTLGPYYIYNPNATVTYVQIFDVSGTVTLGTTTPTWSIGIPPASAANLETALGLNFAAAIKIAATTTRAGSTAPGTGLDVNFGYK